MDIRTYLQIRGTPETATAVRWTLQAGRAMPKAAREWTRGECRLIRILQHEIDPRWGQCFVTAQAATLVAEQIGIQPHRLTYCEGYASLPGLAAPFRHAWCLLNGQVWDPTPQVQTQAAMYFGREIPTEILRHKVERPRTWRLAAVGA